MTSGVSMQIVNTNPGKQNLYLMYDPCPACGSKDVQNFEYMSDDWLGNCSWTFWPCGCKVKPGQVQDYYAFRFDTKELYNKEARTHELRKAAEERRKKS